MARASSSGHQRTIQPEKPSSTRVISGRSALKAANTVAKVGMTNRFTATSARPMATVTIIG